MADFFIVLFLCVAGPWFVYQVTKSDEPKDDKGTGWCAYCGQKMPRRKG